MIIGIEKVVELSLSALPTLVAAWAGAFFAFKYNRRHEEEKACERQVEECNRAMLVLQQQFDILVQYREHAMAPHVSKPGRHFSMVASPKMPYSDLQINAPALSFLLQSKTKAATLPRMLVTADREFHDFLSIVDQRSEDHFKFQQALQASAIDLTDQPPLAALEAAIGPLLTHRLRRGTDRVYASIAEAIDVIEMVGKTAPGLLKVVFPSYKVVEWEPMTASPAAERKKAANS